MYIFLLFVSPKILVFLLSTVITGETVFVVILKYEGVVGGKVGHLTSIPVYEG